MISVEKWALIRALKNEGLSGRAIARQLGIDRGTVGRALSADLPPSYTPRPVVASAWSGIEDSVRALLDEFPALPATVLAERVGWTGSASWFRANVAAIRPEYRRVDPADRLVHLPGEQVQCDLWFPPVDVPVGQGVSARLPVLVMVAAYARFIAAVMLPSRRTGDLLAGMWRVLANDIQAVPKHLLWDNEAGIGRGGRLAEGVDGWCGTLGTRIKQTKPYDPETKGVVERANRYLETSFMPGRAFASPEDFNAQLAAWLTGHANCRLVRSTGRVPAEAINLDRSRMGSVSPLAPVCWAPWTCRLGRDYYVTAAGNDYSVDPSLIDRLVRVNVTLGRVEVHHADRLVTTHQRSWASRQTITDPTHVAAAGRLRQQFQQAPHRTDGDEGFVRDLSVYDRLFGAGPEDLAPTVGQEMV